MYKYIYIYIYILYENNYIYSKWQNIKEEKYSQLHCQASKTTDSNELVNNLLNTQ